MRPMAPIRLPQPQQEDGEPFHKRAVAAARLFEQPLLAVLGVAALVFGFFGYRQYFHSTNQPSGNVDTLYATLQLIKLSSRVNTANVPWALNVGRLLAPAVSGYAAFRGLGALYRDRLDRLRVQAARDHVVVVGASPAATAITRSLCRQGCKVVVVDPDLTPERAASLRSIGALTVVGDGARPEVLHQAGAHRARQVLALTDDDARNIDIALRVHSRSGRRGSPRSMGSVSRADLCELLRIEALGAGGAAMLDFFNGHELTARTVERTALATVVGDVLVIAPAIDAAQILARLARAGFAGTVRLEGRDAAAAVLLARRRLHDIDARLRLAVHAVEAVDAHEFGDLTTVTRAVIAGDGSEAMALALAVSRRLAPGAMVALVLPDSAHLAPLLAAGAADRHVPIVLVDSLAWWSDPDLVLGGTMEVIARATHQNYLESRAAAGLVPAGDAAMVPWERLPKSLKESNRNQARHLWVKLAAVGCALAPTVGAEASFAFTPAEVEQLSGLEHERWVAERLGDGWRLGPRDIAAKTTPHLAPWEDLTEDIRDLDRAAVRGLPAFVADVGYQIVRTSAKESS